MKRYKYLLVGGGMAAAAAVEGIREVDAEGSIGILSADADPPYDRPPLSKKLWTGKKTVAEIMRQAAAAGAELHLGRSVVSLALGAREVHDERGEAFGYQKLLLATGGTPRRLPFGDERILYFRTLADYRALRALADEHERFAVVGAGFIGSELGAALAMNGKRVTMIFPESGICSRLFPPEVSRFLVDAYRERGVEVLAGDTMHAVEGLGSNLAVATTGGRRLEVAGIVAGIGIQPNLELARAAGLTVADGIVVEDSLATSHPDVYAAGDSANFPDRLLGVRRRVEHEDNANAMGRAAGRAMAGESVRYDHSPMFYSDLFDLGYEAVGELDSRLEVVLDWQEPFRKGVLYYLAGDRLRGVLLWNVWDRVEAARALIAEGRAWRPEDLAGRIT